MFEELLNKINEIEYENIKYSSELILLRERLIDLKVEKRLNNRRKTILSKTFLKFFLNNSKEIVGENFIVFLFMLASFNETLRISSRIDSSYMNTDFALEYANNLLPLGSVFLLINAAFLLDDAIERYQKRPLMHERALDRDINRCRKCISQTKNIINNMAFQKHIYEGLHYLILQGQYKKNDECQEKPSADKLLLKL